MRYSTADLIYKNPRSLIYHQRVPRLINAVFKSEDGEDSDTCAYCRDPIEVFSLFKLRGAIILLFGVLLFFAGGFLMSYGERIGDLKHDFAFWSGWTAIALGSAGVLGTLMATIITHLDP
jgi:hypothetical protein